MVFFFRFLGFFFFFEFVKALKKNSKTQKKKHKINKILLIKIQQLTIKPHQKTVTNPHFTPPNDPINILLHRRPFSRPQFGHFRPFRVIFTAFRRDFSNSEPGFGLSDSRRIFSSDLRTLITPGKPLLVPEIAENARMGVRSISERCAGGAEMGPGGLLGRGGGEGLRQTEEMEVVDDSRF
jgi:hypothetical protein